MIHAERSPDTSDSIRLTVPSRHQLTFAQIIGSHKVGFGGAGPDPLPGLVFRVSQSPQQYVPLALVLQAFPVSVVTSLGAYGKGGPDQQEGKQSPSTQLLRVLQAHHLFWGSRGGRLV